MDMVYCHGCGKQIHKTAPGCPGCGAPQKILQPAQIETRADGSKNWYLEPLKKYAQFSGRARRKEYWYFFLFNFIIATVLAAGSDKISGLYNIAMFIPTIATGARRLHDTGRTGWWLLLPIVNIIFLAQTGNVGTNKYGADPKTA